MRHEFPLPDGGSWIVRAFSFETADQARAVWEEIEEGSRGKKANFSIWRSTNPERTEHFVVVCARREHLPEVPGTPYDLDYENARMFALRRARVGADHEALGVRKHLEQEMRYGEETPVTINPETGGVDPYRWQ